MTLPTICPECGAKLIVAGSTGAKPLTADCPNCDKQFPHIESIPPIDWPSAPATPSAPNAAEFFQLGDYDDMGEPASTPKSRPIIPGISPAPEVQAATYQALEAIEDLETQTQTLKEHDWQCLESTSGPLWYHPILGQGLEVKEAWETHSRFQAAEEFKRTKRKAAKSRMKQVPEELASIAKDWGDKGQSIPSGLENILEAGLPPELLPLVRTTKMKKNSITLTPEQTAQALRGQEVDLTPEQKAVLEQPGTTHVHHSPGPEDCWAPALAAEQADRDSVGVSEADPASEALYAKRRGPQPSPETSLGISDPPAASDKVLETLGPVWKPGAPLADSLDPPAGPQSHPVPTMGSATLSVNKGTNEQPDWQKLGQVKSLSIQQELGQTRAQVLITEIANEMRDLLLKKNTNYGSSVFKHPKMAQDLEPGMAIRVRLSDKLERLENLLKGNPDLVGESIVDTIKDLIGYYILWLVWIRHTGGEV